MSNKIKVIVSGAAGKMGVAVIGLIPLYKNIVLTGAIEKKGHPLIDQDISSVSHKLKGVTILDDLRDAIGNSDIIIEFTSPETTLKHLEIAESYPGRAFVIGVTGFTKEQEAKIKEYAKKIACIKAPNMSTGMNLLFNIVGKVAKVLGEDYDAEIVEIHHKAKVDVPSGTAKRLAEVIVQAYGENYEDIVNFGRKSPGPRPKGEIGIHAVRAGSVIGEHKVIFAGGGEHIEITHRAESRDAFAHGALKAAQWVAGRKPGLYGMNDVLGL
ncbi:MAG: 4-hydroxy-tetrahydrodipicolinate reductase [Candidatus Ratteibacteria bacterium]|nr:4-hydroxy-tetrahydrodipicolinate reductase [Candidatus Ratteibacteria bacterium]